MALRGTISPVRMADKLLLLRPTLCPIHWAIAARAGWAYNSELGQQVWGTPGMLRTIIAAALSETDFAVLTLAVFSVCHGLRVGDSQAASIRTSDISQPGWISFYDRQTKRRWILARLGVWRSGGDKACWHAGSSSAEPNTCHSSRRLSSNAVCTSSCGAPCGRGSPGTAGDDSLRQPWSHSAPPSLPCASRTGGLRNGKHGSTPS